jgi:hypothetical protein
VCGVCVCVCCQVSQTEKTCTHTHTHTPHTHHTHTTHTHVCARAQLKQRMVWDVYTSDGSRIGSQNIERLWNRLKGYLRKMHALHAALTPETLQMYLDDYAFRVNAGMPPNEYSFTQVCQVCVCVCVAEWVCVRALACLWQISRARTHARDRFDKLTHKHTHTHTHTHTPGINYHRNRCLPIK